MNFSNLWNFSSSFSSLVFPSSGSIPTVNKALALLDLLKTRGKRREEEEDEIYKKFLESSSKSNTSSTSRDQNAKSNTSSSNTDQNKTKKPSEKSASSDNPTESK